MKLISHLRTQESHSHLFVIFWLCILAALLAWKGATYAEMALLRQYLGMTEPSASSLWWFASGCVTALVIVWSGYMLLMKARARGWMDSVTYVAKPGT